MSIIKSLIRKTTNFPATKNTDNNLEPIQKNNTATNSTANTPIEQTRWNGWGNVSINKTVSPHGAKLIKSHIGKTISSQLIKKCGSDMRAVKASLIG